MSTNKHSDEYDRGSRQNFTAYLGIVDLRIDRQRALKILAMRFTGGNTSKLIQMIADGDLELVRPVIKP